MLTMETRTLHFNFFEDSISKNSSKYNLQFSSDNKNFNYFSWKLFKRRNRFPVETSAIDSRSFNKKYLDVKFDEETTTDLFEFPPSDVYTVFSFEDFQIFEHVSIGLCGQSDEMLFEAVVTNPDSPLRGTTVVLRKLVGKRALKWGQRALKASPTLIRGNQWRHPYSMCLHGFVPPTSPNDPSFTLVHGHYGSYSLHQWLHCSDWLSLLEARLALGEVGGTSWKVQGEEDEVMRQLRLVRTVTRDLLTGVNFLHSRGIANLDLRLQNVHISTSDKRVKVGILGLAVDLPNEKVTAGTPPLRQRIVSQDIRKVGIMMVQMIFRELIQPQMFSQLKRFLAKGHHPSLLREFLHPLNWGDQPLENSGIKVLDLNGGAGWHLLAALLNPEPSKQISCQDALQHTFLLNPDWRRSDSSTVELTWSIGSTVVKLAEEFTYKRDQRRKLNLLISLLERLRTPISAERWDSLAPGTWRLAYHTGPLIGISLRQPEPLIQVGRVELIVSAEKRSLVLNVPFFTGGPTHGTEEKKGLLVVQAKVQNLDPKLRLLLNLVPEVRRKLPSTNSSSAEEEKVAISVLGVSLSDVAISAEFFFDGADENFAKHAIREVRLQLPKELFDLNSLTCVSRLDERLMVMRGVTGASFLFVKTL